MFNRKLGFIFSTYMMRQFLFWFGVILLILGFLVWTLDVVELLRRSAAKDEVTFALVLQMAFLKLPETIQKIFPFLILFASMFTLMRMTKSGELIIARASGLSVWQFLAPMIFSAVLIGVVNITFLHPIGAVLTAKYESLDNKYIRRKANILDISKTGLWLRQSVDGQNYYLHAKTVTKDLKVLNEVMVLLLNDHETQQKTHQKVERIDALKAELKPGEWVLYHAAKYVRGKTSVPVERMTLPAHLTFEQIEDSFSRPETISFWELPAFIAMLDKTGLSSDRHRLYYQFHLAQPMFLGVMVLFAALFTLKFNRDMKVVRLILSGLITGLGFYILHDILFALGLSTKIPIVLAAWAPPFIGLGIAVPFLMTQEES